MIGLIDFEVKLFSSRSLKRFAGCVYFFVDCCLAVNKSYLAGKDECQSVQQGRRFRRVCPGRGAQVAATNNASIYPRSPSRACPGGINESLLVDDFESAKSKVD